MALTLKEKTRQEDLQRLRGLRPTDDDFMLCLFKDNKMEIIVAHFS